MLQEPLAVFAVLALVVVASEWLEGHTRVGKLGAATWTILLGALAANLRLVPSSNAGNPAYDWLFGTGIQLAVFWLLLRVRLADLVRVGPRLLVLFLVGALSIAGGVALSMTLLGGPAAFGEHGAGLGAMFVGTYIGGSPNFFSLAELYRVGEAPVLVAAATVVDAGMTALWMVLGVVVPRWLERGRPSTREVSSQAARCSPRSASVLDLALALGLGSAALAASGALSAWTASAGAQIPPVLWMTGLALLLAQIPAVSKIASLDTLGLLFVYLFLAAIGALCDGQALVEAGPIAARLALLVALALAVHGAVTFGLARLLGWPAIEASIASQANIGGGSSALALARALGRPDLGAPAILIGALGTACGTFVGLAVGSWILGGSTVG